MDNEKTAKPMQFWNNALRAVKGDSTHQLVEQFTSEMTLVAEGLCEDQARLRKQVEDLALEGDRANQRAFTQLQALETAMDEHQRDTDRRLSELSRRLDAIDNRIKSTPREKKNWLSGGLMQQLILLVSIPSLAWVLVSLLQLFR